jgi:hypothetical protein
MLLLLPLLAAASAVATGPDAEVSVASGDWNDIPALLQTGDLQISDKFAEQLSSAAGTNGCSTVGTAKHVNVSMPFLVQYSPQGAVQRVVVHRIDCPAVETIVGSVVLRMAQHGDYRPTGYNREGWYRGQFAFESRQ